MNYIHGPDVRQRPGVWGAPFQGGMSSRMRSEGVALGYDGPALRAGKRRVRYNAGPEGSALMRPWTLPPYRNALTSGPLFV
jgi:hypothetical protein